MPGSWCFGARAGDRARNLSKCWAQTTALTYRHMGIVKLNYQPTRRNSPRSTPMLLDRIGWDRHRQGQAGLAQNQAPKKPASSKTQKPSTIARTPRL